MSRALNRFGWDEEPTEPDEAELALRDRARESIALYERARMAHAAELKKQLAKLGRPIDPRRRRNYGCAKRVRCVVTDEVFRSITMAARSAGVPLTTFQARLGIAPSGRRHWELC
jgi:hypothetical protein